MNSELHNPECEQAPRVSLYALQALPVVEMDAVKAHIDTCPSCDQQMQRLRPVMDSLTQWPTDVLRPRSSLWPRLAAFVQPSAEGDAGADISIPGHAASLPGWTEPQWQQVADGISCKTLAVDSECNELTLLVRLGPGVEYPPHRHGGVEELHLLAGELWIGDRHLRPGDYNRAEPGTTDTRVWTETGCTCLLITSSQDILL